MNNNTVKKLDPQDVIKLLAALRRAIIPVAAAAGRVPGAA